MQLVSSIYRYTHSIATAALRYGKARLNHFVPLPTSFHRIGSTFKETLVVLGVQGHGSIIGFGSCIRPRATAALRSIASASPIGLTR